jgi:hypothetical protein
MGILRCAEHWDGRSGTFENVTSNRVRRKWLVVTDDKYLDPLDVAAYFAATVGIVWQTPHPSDSNYTARSLEVDPKSETPFAYDVVVTYSTEPFRADEQEQNILNPTNRPPRITWDSETVQQFTTKDKDGKPMLNSAGDPLEPIEKDDIRWIISLTKNFASLPLWILNCVNVVNSSAVTVSGVTLPTRTVKTQRLRISDLLNENGFDFYEVTIELAYKPDTWDVDRLDEGFNVIAGDGDIPASEKKRIRIEDDEGEFQETTEAVPLDGAGGVLANPDPDNCVYRTSEIYEDEDLNALPFS